jgi:hypothetical protein
VTVTLPVGVTTGVPMTVALTVPVSMTLAGAPAVVMPVVMRR